MGVSWIKGMFQIKTGRPLTEKSREKGWEKNGGVHKFLYLSFCSVRIVLSCS